MPWCHHIVLIIYPNFRKYVRKFTKAFEIALRLHYYYLFSSLHRFTLNFFHFIYIEDNLLVYPGPALVTLLGGGLCSLRMRNKILFHTKFD